MQSSTTDQSSGAQARMGAWRDRIADLFSADPPSVHHRWLRPAVDLLLLAAMLTTVAAAQRGNQIPPVVLLLLTLAAWAPLPFRYRHPGPALIAAVLIEGLHLVLLPILLPDLQVKVDVALYQPVPIATTVAAFALAERASSGRGWIGGVLAGAVLLTVAVVVHPASLLGVDMVMFNVVVLGTALGALIATRRIRAARIELAHREHVEKRVIAERLRIARDLHDVLAHHLTLVNAQAGVAGYLLEMNPVAAGRALRDIHRHTGDALDELRATVGLLRQVNDTTAEQSGDDRRPVPGLKELPTLIDGFRAIGDDIDAVVGTLPDLPPSVDLAAYRIVQEALTNAAKHATGSGVRLRVDGEPHQLAIMVRSGPSRGRDPARPNGPGTGNGLIGMRERAKSCGGTVSAEPTADGGFLVSAVLPIRTTTEGRST